MLTVVAIAFFGGAVEPSGWYDADDVKAGAGRWLAGLASLALAAIHGARASEVQH